MEVACCHGYELDHLSHCPLVGVCMQWLRKKFGFYMDNNDCYALVLPVFKFNAWMLPASNF